jgi:tetratricopeptide (TPR) repeat protein
MTEIGNAKQWREEYPSDPIPLINLGNLEIQIGRSALALEAARRAIELNPSNASAYEVLASAQMHLGQFEEAAATCRQAIGHHADSVQIHGILLQIAFRNLDEQALDEQIAWASGSGDAKPEAAYMQVQQGFIDFAEGRAKAAQAIFTTLADRYRKQGQTDLANRILEGVPRIEAELGLTDAARALLNRLPSAKDTNPSTGATDIAVAWADLGETSRAEALLQQELDAHPSATLWQEYNGPQIRAAIALNQHHLDAAVDALQPAAQYDLRSFDAPALRGRAYLALGQPALAEAEFHKILDHPGIEPLSHNYPLAQLGLARALAQQDKTVEAGFAYKVVFQIWNDADPELPRLREAKAEYAKLNGVPAKSSSKPRHK